MGLEPGNTVEAERFGEAERRWGVRKVKRGGRSEMKWGPKGGPK